MPKISEDTAGRGDDICVRVTISAQDCSAEYPSECGPKRYWPPNKLTAFADWMSNFLDTVPVEYRDGATVGICTREEICYIEITYYRPATAEEAAKHRRWLRKYDELRGTPGVDVWTASHLADQYAESTEPDT